MGNESLGFIVQASLFSFLSLADIETNLNVRCLLESCLKLWVNVLPKKVNPEF